MRRDYPGRPIVGVAAVVIEDDCVVLVRRGQAPAYGDWSLPGGAVELGETLEEAIVREVEEEIGLKVKVIDLIAVLDRIFLDEAGQVQFHYVLMDFLCLKAAGLLRASGDVLACAQVPMASLTHYKLSRETEEVIKRAHQRLNGEGSGIYLTRTSIPTRE